MNRVRICVLLVLVLSMVLGGVTQSLAASQFAGSDPIEVSIAMWNFSSPDGDYAAEKFVQKVKDEFGIALKIVAVTWADANERIRMLAAADELPDVFVHLGWDMKFEFKDFVDQELLHAIPQELYSKYEKLNEVMTTYAYEAMPDGEMYNLPREDRAWEKTNGNPIGLYYRKDYAEKLGYTEEQLQTPMTIAELTKFLEAMTNGDPDGNGENDTYGLGNALDTGTGLGFLRELIYPMFGYRPWIFNAETNAWECGWTSEAAKEATAWLHDLYGRGILDPEFAILKDSQMLEKFSSGRLGVAPYNMNASNATYLRANFFELINPGTDIADHVSALPLPTMEDGTRNSRPKAYWSSTLISYAVDDEKLDRILALFDWLYSVDGYMFAYWGEENVDYVIENGQVASLLTDAEGKAKRFSSGTPIALAYATAGWHLDGSPDLINTTVSDWDLKMDGVLRNDYWPFNYPVDFTTYLFSPALNKFDINSYVETQLVTLIMQSKDFEADWAAFVKDLFDNYNLAAVTEEVNAAATEKGIEWVPYKN